MNLEQSGLQMEFMLRVVNLFFFFFGVMKYETKVTRIFLGQ